MSQLREYTTEPQKIQAMQFYGWEDALRAYDRGFPIFYVPQGAECSLRRQSEFDKSTGNVLEHAPAFLTLWIIDQKVRVDLGDWLTFDGEHYRYMMHDEFKNTYIPTEDVS